MRALGVIRRRLPGTPRRSSHIIIFKQYNTSRCVLLQPHLNLKFFNFFQTKTTNMTVLALSLFVFWILADYSDASFSFNDFAFFTDRFNRWSNFHWNPPFLSLGRMAIVVSLAGFLSYGRMAVVVSPWGFPLSGPNGPGVKTFVFKHKKITFHKSSLYSIAPCILKCKQIFRVF